MNFPYKNKNYVELHEFLTVCFDKSTKLNPTESLFANILKKKERTQDVAQVVKHMPCKI